MVRRFGCLIAAVAAVALARGSASAQTAGSLRVVRAADRRGLIILLPAPLDTANVGKPLDVTRYTLIDVHAHEIVPLSHLSRIDPAGCPSPPSVSVRSGSTGPDRRICVVIDDSAARARGAPAVLDDAGSYALLVDSIAVMKAGKRSHLGAATILIGPVAGHVVAPAAHPPEEVEVTYDVDVSRDSTLALRLSVNDRPISVWSPTSGTDSLCHARSNYTRGSMSFRCVTKNLVLHNGDSLSAQFVRDPPTATALPPGKIVPAKDTVKRSVPATDTSLYVVGSLAQTNGSQAATVQASVRNVPLPWLRTVGDRYSGSLSPYLDALWTTDPTTKGYVNLGAQYNGYLSELGPVLQQIAFFITPRTESDKKLTVMNFMYLDAEVRPGIYGLYTGRLPLGGHYRVWPHAGVELGHTIKGTAVVRPESNDPSRWKAGVNVIAGWPASKSKSFFCTVFGCAGFDINADYQHYWLNDVPVAAPTARDVGTIKATYKFTDHVGLALAYQNGNPPPLFAYQRVIQIGISFMR